MLVHCLAGAHRAGTTGIISLMHFQVEGDDKDEDEGDEDHEDILVQGLDSSEAIKRAKSRRPIIEPIGDFRSEKFNLRNVCQIWLNVFLQVYLMSLFVFSDKNFSAE